MHNTLWGGTGQPMAQERSFHHHRFQLQCLVCSRFDRVLAVVYAMCLGYAVDLTGL